MTTTPPEQLLTPADVAELRAQIDAKEPRAENPEELFSMVVREVERALLAKLREQQPVAFMWQHDETGRTGFVDPWQVANGWQAANPRCAIVKPLYAAPVPTPAAQAGQAVPAEIMAICQRLHTQDNRITDNPLFAVQEKREIAGLDDGYADAWAWVNDDCEEITGEDEVARLEAAHANGDDTPGARRIGMTHRWEFVTGCLTEQGCKDYIKANGHNLHSPRIYAYGSYRNSEFIALRKWLMSLAAPTPTGAGDDSNGGA